MRWLLFAVVLGCGAAPVREPAVAPRAEPTPAPELVADPVAPPPAPPTDREVLIDGVRDGMVVDALDGWSLVSGEGTVALVGPDARVHAAHRLAFGDYGAAAAFTDGGHAVVANTDAGGFRSPWADELDRWDLDSDTLEQLAQLGYDMPSVVRLGRWALVGDGYAERSYLVGATSVEDLGVVGAVAALPGQPERVAIHQNRLVIAYAVLEGDSIVLEDVSEDAPELEIIVGTDLALAAAGSPGAALVRLPGLEPVAIVGLRDGEVPTTVFPYGSDTYVRFAAGDLERDLLVSTMTWHDAGPHPYGMRTPNAPCPNLGAHGIHDFAFAPTSSRLVLVGGGRAVVVGEGGIGPSLDGMESAHWAATEVALFSYGRVRPFDVPSTAARSLMQPDLSLYSDEASDETHALETWEYALEEEPDLPRPVFPPICSAPPRARCVRESASGDGPWEVFDPGRPSRVLGSVAGGAPPSLGSTRVAPGGRWLRDVLPYGEGVWMVSLPRGTEIASEIQEWVELETAWVWLDVEDPSVVHALPFDRPAPIARTMAEPLLGIVISDAETAIVWDARTIHVLRARDLETVRTIDHATGGPHPSWLCLDGSLVDDAGSAEPTFELACPTDALYGRSAQAVSPTGAFWVGSPYGDVATVHRVADGAWISIRLSPGGVLVSGPTGVFEGEGDLLEHVVVRDAGPVRSAAITVGADARARFERPGLVAAFFRGEPLPTAD